MTGLYGGDGNDNMEGDDGDDTIFGGDGNDLIYGDSQGEDDTSGNDVIHGGTGNDRVYGGNGDDQISGGEGDDRLRGDDGDDTLFGGAGEDDIEGDDGNDTIYGGTGDDDLDGYDDNDLLFGGEGDDEVDGGDGDDRLYGGDGNDSMEGDDDDDAVFGGDGNDYIRGGRGNDLVEGGDGNDLLHGDHRRESSSGDPEMDDFGVFLDRLRTEGEDFLEGEGGLPENSLGHNNDVLNGGAGNDIIDGDQGDDTLDGGTGIDHVDGGTGQDVGHFTVGEGGIANKGTEGETYEFYDGNQGEDTLVVHYTADDIDPTLNENDAEIVTELRMLKEFIDSKEFFNDGFTNDGETRSYEYLGLKVQDWENIVLDGPELPVYAHTVDLNMDDAAVNEDTSFTFDVSYDLGGDSEVYTVINSVMVSGIPAGAVLKDGDGNVIFTNNTDSDAEFDVKDVANTTDMTLELPADSSDDVTLTATLDTTSINRDEVNSVLSEDGTTVVNPVADDFEITADIDEGAGTVEKLTGEPDEFDAAGGDDVIFGGNGGDTILGGMGDDTIIGGSNETLVNTGNGSGQVTNDDGINSIANAQNIDDAFSLAADADIADSESVPHVSVTGTGDGEYHYYEFTVEVAGSVGTFDIDYGMNAGGSFDSVIQLYDASGNAIAYNDDSPIDPGSVHYYDSQIEHTFEEAGTYYVRVREFGNSPVDENDTYELQVSIENHAVGGPELQTQEEILVGGDGNDTIFGESGDDIIYGDNRDGDTVTAELTIDLSKIDEAYDGTNHDTTDGSESYSITIDGVPADGSLSAGVKNPDGTYTLTAAQLVGLAITVPAGTASFDVDISVTNSDNNGGDDTTTSTITHTLEDVAFTNPGGNDDDLYGGTGRDEIHGQQGDDDIYFIVGQGGDGEGHYESLDGGKDTDTLHVETQTVTADEVAQLYLLERFIADNSDTDSTDGTGAVFTSDILGITAQNFEAITFSDPLPTYTHTVDIADQTVSEDDTVIFDITYDLDGESLASLTSVSLSGIPAGAVLKDADGNVILDNSEGDATADDVAIDLDDLTGLQLVLTPDSSLDVDLTVDAVTYSPSHLMDHSVDPAVIGTGAQTPTDDADITVDPVADDFSVTADIDEGAADYEKLTGQPDEFDAAGGDDIVHGLGGGDTILGGMGDDIIHGGSNRTGPEPESVTIDINNVTDTDGGYTVTATKVNGEDGSISTTNSSHHEGFGVHGRASGADIELGQDGRGSSETITVEFENDVSSIDVSFAWQHSGEEAHYDFYKDGVKVGEGNHMGISDGIDPAITLAPTNGSEFDSVVFSAPGNGDDYLIHSIEFERTHVQEEILVGGDGDDIILGNTGDDIIYGDNREGDTVTADLNIDIAKIVNGVEGDGDNLDEADGSESYSIEVTVPAGATLSAGAPSGTDPVVYTLTAAQLVGLTITVAAGTPSFDVDVSVTNSDNNGVDDTTDTRTITVEDVAFTNPGGNNDTLYGQGGVDEVHGQIGDDLVFFRVGEGGTVGNLESLDGGKDFDTLVIEHSISDVDAHVEGSDAAKLVAEMYDLQTWISENSDSTSTDGNGASEEFNLLGIEIQNFENVVFTPPLPTYEHTTEIVFTNGMENPYDGEGAGYVEPDAVVNEDSIVEFNVAVDFEGEWDASVTSVAITGIPDGAELYYADDATNSTPVDPSNVDVTKLDGLKLDLGEGANEHSNADFTLTATVSTTSPSGDQTPSDTGDVDVLPVSDGVILGADATVSGIGDPGTGDNHIGTIEDETILGGAGDDTISALGGDDVIWGDKFEGDVTINLGLDPQMIDVDGSERYMQIRIVRPPEGIEGGEYIVWPNGTPVWILHGSSESVMAAAGDVTITVPHDMDDLTVTVQAYTNDVDDEGIYDRDQADLTTQDITISVSNLGVAGNDELHGGNGVDEVHGEGGDDTIFFTIGEGGPGEGEGITNPYESLDGGADTDTLSIVLSEADAGNADLVAELYRLEHFVVTNSDADSVDGAGAVFTSDLLGITAQNFEDVTFSRPLPTYTHTVAIADQTVAEDSTVTFDITVDLDGEAGAAVQSVALTGVPAGATLRYADDSVADPADLDVTKLSGLKLELAEDSSLDVQLSVDAVTTSPSHLMDHSVDPAVAGDGEQEPTDTAEFTVTPVAESLVLGDVGYTAQTPVTNDTTGETWTGTDGPDVKSGTDKDDNLTGLEGGDTILGLAGNDIINGGGNTFTGPVTTETAFTGNANSDAPSGHVWIYNSEPSHIVAFTGSTSDAQFNVSNLDNNEGMTWTAYNGDPSNPANIVGGPVTVSRANTGSYSTDINIQGDNGAVFTHVVFNALPEGPNNPSDIQIRLDGHTEVVTTTETVEQPELLVGGIGDDIINGEGGNDKIFGDNEDGSAGTAVEVPTEFVAGLNIAAATRGVDADGSETPYPTLYQITGAPAGSLSVGSDVDGVWTVEEADLASLTVTVPFGSTTPLELQVVAVGRDFDEDGTGSVVETASAPKTISIDVPTEGPASPLTYDDQITGGAGDDVILGQQGNDVIYGDNKAVETETQTRTVYDEVPNMVEVPIMVEVPDVKHYTDANNGSMSFAAKDSSGNNATVNVNSNGQYGVRGGGSNQSIDSYGSGGETFIINFAHAATTANIAMASYSDGGDDKWDDSEAVRVTVHLSDGGSYSFNHNADDNGNTISINPSGSATFTKVEIKAVDEVYSNQRGNPTDHGDSSYVRVDSISYTHVGTKLVQNGTELVQDGTKLVPREEEYDAVVGGNDNLFGGEGNDSIHGEGGSDWIVGGEDDGSIGFTPGFTVSYQGNTAAYDNSFGYYIKDADGNPTEGTVIWSDIHDTNIGATYHIQDQLSGIDTADIGFFIIPNGGHLNADLSNEDEVTFSQDANGNWVVTTKVGDIDLVGQDANVFFSDGSLNPDGIDHLTSHGDGNSGFEDLINLGDADFDDVLFNIRPTEYTVQTFESGDDLWGNSDQAAGGDASKDVFLFGKGDGVDTIHDFEVGIDQLVISGYSENEMTIFDDENGNAIVSLGYGNEAIKLMGVSSDDLSGVDTYDGADQDTSGALSAEELIDLREDLFTDDPSGAAPTSQEASVVMVAAMEPGIMDPGNEDPTS